MSNENGTIWVVFNGEIYNYRELGSELRRRGHEMRTRCDTEVLLHAYEEYGVSFPGRLNGIFAFALYDTEQQRLLLARDHLGVKPLFYAQQDGAVAFASEIKSVLIGLGLKPAIRPEALQEYLIFRYVAGDRSFFENVNRLPPGHIAVFENGELRISEYWSPPDEPVFGRMPLAEATEELDRRLSVAVERQMMSDVPLGALCSGGVDSGLVTKYAAEFSNHALNTFSVGFDDPQWDESALARDTAARFNTVHRTVTSRPETFRSLMAELIWFNDEPLSHPNSIPLFQLSKLARETVTVVLTGEGADELFGGYPRYHIARLRGMARHVPRYVLRVASRATGAIGDHRASKLRALVPISYPDSLLFNSAFVDPNLVARISGAALDKALAQRRAYLRASLVGDDGTSSISRYELRTYLVSALDRMDRMSMAVSLEARVPFLDVELVEWGARLHPYLKLGVKRNKHVVKQLARRSLHSKIVSGSKSGFGVPLGAWFKRGDFRELIEDATAPSSPLSEILDQGILRTLLGEHISGAIDHGELFWLIANVVLWYQLHVTHGVSPGGPESQ
jgi:asparagine synthase (glutamine-hydrolysing)